MTPAARLLAACLLAAAALPSPGARAAERPARPRFCPDDLPEGVRLPPQPGCAAGSEAPRPRADGWRDLGGVSVRVGGRAAAEYGVRR